MPEITVRGQKGFDLRGEADDSRTDPNAPLYIMDGIEVSAQTVYDMDMNRIAAFSILKDASATSLYGSRGAEWGYFDHDGSSASRGNQGDVER